MAKPAVKAEASASLTTIVRLPTAASKKVRQPTARQIEHKADKTNVIELPGAMSRWQREIADIRSAQEAREELAAQADLASCLLIIRAIGLAMEKRDASRVAMFLALGAADTDKAAPACAFWGRYVLPFLIKGEAN